ncbi:MAG: 16S rRNA (uracil(1498)-N(3))-methyltransferase [Pseudomonadales bacterium]
MLKHRLYLPPPLATAQTVTVDAARAHYLGRVLRLRRGAALICFDGVGSAWQATLTAIDSRSATLTLDAQVASESAPSPRLHLVQGLLKGGAMDEVLQKATELGATDLWLIDAARSNVAGATRSAPERQARKLGHWQRILHSAAEQCGALHLPILHGPMDLAQFFATSACAHCLLFDPGGMPLPMSLPRVDTAVLIGPEGGWSDAELALAVRHDAGPWRLGNLVLRAETAPLVVLSVIRHGWGWA